MQGIFVKLIFDKALTLELGESMLVPCYSDSQRESLRVQLYHHKKEWEASGHSDFDVVMTKITNKEGRFIQIQRTKKVDSIIVLRKDGSADVISIDQPGAEYDIPTTPIEAEERIRKLMKEDGKTDEEIEEYFSSKTSNNDTS